jgi:AcrR family transcriptional regulator
MAPRTARGDRARADILASARTQLLESGPDGLSLREVARGAGYAPSALYNHFAGREDLVTALAVEAVGTLAAYLEAAPAGTPAERLRGLARAYLAFAREHAEGYRTIFDCLANPPHSWDEYSAVAHPFGLIVEACAAGLANGEFVDPRGVGPSGLAYGFWALVDGHVHLRQKHLSNVDGPYDAMFEAALDATLAGIASRRDAR